MINKFATSLESVRELLLCLKQQTKNPRISAGCGGRDGAWKKLIEQNGSPGPFLVAKPVEESDKANCRR